MMRSVRAFTLLQIVFLVALLAVVAALVVPTFTQAGTEEACMDDLCSNLQLLRSQIELYKIQHGDYPPMHAADGTIVFDMQFKQMLYCTNTDGNVKPKEPRTDRDKVYTFGPYLKRVPANPFNKSQKIVRARSRDDIPVEGNAGWAYVPETGDIYANDTAGHSGL